MKGILSTWVVLGATVLVSIGATGNANGQTFQQGGTTFEFPIARVFRLHVSVIDVQGRPISAANVTVSHAEFPLARPATGYTDAQGRVSFPPRDLGGYHVTVRREPLYEPEVLFINARQADHQLQVFLFPKGQRPQAPAVINNSCIVCHQQR